MLPCICFRPKIYVQQWHICTAVGMCFPSGNRFPSVLAVGCRFEDVAGNTLVNALSSYYRPCTHEGCNFLGADQHRASTGARLSYTCLAPPQKQAHVSASQVPKLFRQALGALFWEGPHRSTMVLYSCSDLKMMGKKWICPSGFVCVSCAAQDDKVISCADA